MQLIPEVESFCDFISSFCLGNIFPPEVKYIFLKCNPQLPFLFGITSPKG